MILPAPSGALSPRAQTRVQDRAIARKDQFLETDRGEPSSTLFGYFDYLREKPGRFGKQAANGAIGLHRVTDYG